MTVVAIGDSSTASAPVWGVATAQRAIAVGLTLCVAAALTVVAVLVLGFGSSVGYGPTVWFGGDVRPPVPTVPPAAHQVDAPARI